MNIYIRELKSNLKSFFFWCIGVIFIIAGGMGKFSGFSSSNESLSTLMDKIPRSLLAIFGMNDLDMSTASGFYAVIFLYILIVSAIYAAMLGAGIISKEERDKTSEFLFTRPVTRVRVITAKILAALTYTVLFNLATVGLSLTMAAIVAPESLSGFESGLGRDLIVLGAGMIFVQLIYLFMGTATAALIKKPGASAGTATSLVLVTYFISMIIDLIEDLDFLRFLTPFKYFEPKRLINGGNPEAVFVVISGGLIALGVCLTYVFFPKRDLYI